MNGSIAGKCSRISSHNPVSQRRACRRSLAVSKISWNRTRISRSFRKRGSFSNSPSSLAVSSSVRPLGLRRSSRISERNSFRWALVSFALYARVIFPPLPVHGLVEQLGDMEAVHDRSGIREEAPAGGMERRPHVGPVGLHLLPLLVRQLLQ